MVTYCISYYELMYQYSQTIYVYLALKGSSYERWDGRLVRDVGKEVGKEVGNLLGFGDGKVVGDLLGFDDGSVGALDGSDDGSGDGDLVVIIWLVFELVNTWMVFELVNE